MAIMRPRLRIVSLAAMVALCAALAGCSGGVKTTKAKATKDAKLGVVPSPRVVKDGDPVPKGGGRYHVGKPYVIGGKSYVPEENAGYRRAGLASWYGDEFHGRLTANGEVFDRESFSAAHPTLPLPSYVRVTNLDNGRAMTVRVNDRGPYHSNRMVDVSRRTAEALGFKHRGLARVQVEYVGRAPLDGRDEWLSATLTENGRPLRPGATMVATAAPVSSKFVAAGQPAKTALPTSPVVLAALPTLPPAPEPVAQSAPMTLQGSMPLARPVQTASGAAVAEPFRTVLDRGTAGLSPTLQAPSEPTNSPFRLAEFSPAAMPAARVPALAPIPQPRPF